MAVEADTRTRLIDATVEAIDRGGEAAVRLRAIAEQVGIRQPSIYHHFATTDRLIEAAQGARWQRDQVPMTTFFREAFSAATSVDGFHDTVRASLSRAYAPDRWESRRQRFNVLSSAFSRPELLAVLAESQRQVEVQVSEPFRVAQEHGWLRADLDASMLVSWIVGQLNGRIYVEIAPEHFDLAAWDALSIGTVLTVMGLPDAGAIGTMPPEPPEPRELAPIDEFVPVPDPDGTTPERAVAAAVDIVVDGGEAALRMRDVAERIGVREPSLYHFFENRDALVTAAQTQRWRDDQMTLLRLIGSEGGLAETRDEFLAGVWATLGLVLSDERAAARRTRAEILGSAQSRPDLMATIVEQELLVNAALATVIERAQARGWVRGDLAAREFAAWFFGMVNGRVLVELDPVDSDLAQWDAIAHEAVFAALGYPRAAA